MIYKFKISHLLEAITKDGIESILPKEKRKSWKETKTEKDYTDRSGEGAHNRAARALMWLDPRKRASFLRLQSEEGIEITDRDLWDSDLDSTLYDFNVSPDDINTKALVSNWRRLKLRQLWQDAVYSNRERREFWSDSSKVRCIHGLNLFASSKGDEQEIQGCLEKLENLIKRANQGDLAELSCIGMASSRGDKLDNRSPGAISIEFTERKIVWASGRDAWTQFLSSGDEDTRNYFQVRKELEDQNPLSEKIFGAALVKFPGKTAFHKDIMFSEKDLMKNKGFAAEVIIKDYELTPGTVIINISSYLTKPKIATIIPRIQELAKKHFGVNKEFLITVV